MFPLYERTGQAVIAKDNQGYVEKCSSLCFTLRVVEFTATNTQLNAESISGPALTAASIKLWGKDTYFVSYVRKARAQQTENRGLEVCG